MARYSSALLDLCPVRDGLWIGAHPEEAWLLRSLGIGIVYLCALERQQLPEAYGVTTVPMGFRDAQLAAQDWDRILVSAHGIAARIIEAETDVLISCNHGMNRAPLVGGAVLHYLTGVSGADILQMLRAKRDGVLSNQSFADALSSLAGGQPRCPTGTFS